MGNLVLLGRLVMTIGYIGMFSSSSKTNQALIVIILYKRTQTYNSNVYSCKFLTHGTRVLVFFICSSNFIYCPASLVHKHNVFNCFMYWLNNYKLRRRVYNLLNFQCAAAGTSTGGRASFFQPSKASKALKWILVPLLMCLRTKQLSPNIISGKWVVSSFSSHLQKVLENSIHNLSGMKI